MTPERLFEQPSARELALSQARKVDLGCGFRPLAGFLGLDLVSSEPLDVWECNLVNGVPWPFADEQLTDLRSSHLIEHIPACDVLTHEFASSGGERSPVPTPWLREVAWVDALFWFMNEAWRVSTWGARFELRWPALVDERHSPPCFVTTAFVDPTHRRFLPVESVRYFDASWREALGVQQYPLSCDWQLQSLAQGSIGGAHVENIAWLEKRRREL